jgi:hypothetical protein
MLNSQPKYEPVAWWYTKNRIGRELRERYQPPNELPPRLLALVDELREKQATALGPEAEKLMATSFLQ